MRISESLTPRATTHNKFISSKVKAGILSMVLLPSIIVPTLANDTAKFSNQTINKNQLMPDNTKDISQSQVETKQDEVSTNQKRHKAKKQKVKGLKAYSTDDLAIGIAGLAAYFAMKEALDLYINRLESKNYNK